MKKRRADLRDVVKSAEQNALKMLVDLFDWLNSLEPQSTTEVVSIYEHSQAIEAKITNGLAQMGRAATFEAKIEEQKTKLQRASSVSFFLCFHLAF